jgi:CRISPR/Cas system CMR-associated protein Cmr3 (group 5 of RAMP superfamily)
MKKYFLTVVAISLLLVSTSGCVATLTAASNDLDDEVIMLKRTACFGFCPVYTLTIYSDGTVVYEGEEFVKTQGRVETTIDQEKIKQLVSEFEAVGYFSLNDGYVEHTITDAQTVITSITIDGKTKTIEHYHGDLNAPEQLTELENKIDEIVDSNQWIN